ncbi:glycoside hydrolase [Metschnikowia bicuspidata var. bicuspidata NRRL YB-4993]|uniref:Glucan 1,3-beta-glucosidase n=1 Tax=Metschnikowia bicuspidata var. bicuspidata NRRL YB-4993 TaxID=869754 RepID=A0A1A0H9B4_9ASCO|nr:glycoside hydrolase [Metschnikowia bicuspidata var. bicuspidata NRRL YB-4993]OBA20709.1 glycoside hydrolase [Metschnikowia bicuspidata var. bicuspidata NRRL YB-4993]
MRLAYSLLSLTTVLGVNLGGWFVLEPYMTPSFFEPYNDEIVDEYHLTQKLGQKDAQKLLEKHWKSWYTEKDFREIAAAGLNTVRIPIGYWAFVLLQDDPYVTGQQKYLDKAIDWARKHNLKIWIDLHGAPGSQNGFDNSGLRDQIEYQTDGNIKATLTALQSIFNKYGDEKYLDVISGIEMLNEPFGPLSDMNQLKNFYGWANANARSVTKNTLVFHDAFQSFNYWDDFFTTDAYSNVIVDHHHYQVFSQLELEMTIDEHILVACGWGTSALTESVTNVCGEFSAALTDCAPWLNGVGRGARWSGDYDSSSLSNLCTAYTHLSDWTAEHTENVRKYIEAQLDAFELTGGWIFWNWKTEDAIDWDMARLIAAGVFPQPLSDRKYPNQCGF